MPILMSPMISGMEELKCQKIGASPDDWPVWFLSILLPCPEDL